MNQNNNILYFHFTKKIPDYWIKLHMLPTVCSLTPGTTAPLSLWITVMLQCNCKVWAVLEAEATNEPSPLGWKIITPLLNPGIIRIFCPWVYSIEKSFKLCQSLPVATDNSTELSQPTVTSAIEPHSGFCVSGVGLWQRRRNNFDSKCLQERKTRTVMTWMIEEQKWR